MLKKRRRLPKRGPLPFRYVFLLTFVFFIFSTAGGLWIINKGIEPTLVSVAETETKRIATLVINNAINKQINDEVDVNKLIVVETDENGKVTTIDFNAQMVNSILAKITQKVQRNLREAEKGNIDVLDIPDIEVETEGEPEEEGIIYYIPLGQATNNALLGNLGPRVPVRFYVIGNVVSDVKKSIEPYGINNALIEISVHVTVNVQVVIPFATSTTTVENTIPIAFRAVQGDVPQFYNGNGNSNPSIDLPINP
ncbi:sporulation protein YunB [Bacillus alveayuensis]|jgi:sporulation protein YunB|uniref:Sporulation protein YunB n=1 Tax=Aeribacillus alveayuensis TaxID=279215 RepID=A0ABT9VMV2_9BACI|nr:sporulation protein YunB [Bacillus alveayuensis]MDQ0162060.1 sporulation protein YunB [Bacillus alveayuensis]